MKNTKLLQISFINSIGVLLYIVLVSLIMQNGEKLFGYMNNLTGPIMILSLFVFSAAITSLLVFGYPVWLYLENKKKESVKALFYTVGWMFLVLIVIFLTKFIVK